VAGSSIKPEKRTALSGVSAERGEADVDDHDQGGGALAFDAVFVRYAPYVASVGLRLLGRRDEVDDLVQDVFLEAYRGLRQVRDAGAVKGWLATIAVRQASRRLRRRRLAHHLGWRQTEADYESAAGREASPEQRLQLARVYRALDQLPVKLRVPWVLRYIEGEPIERIAEACGISRATAHRRISAAHEALRKAVGDE
jgi:RNA polymerase sigma-70 factor (ECF subfamily)